MKSKILDRILFDVTDAERQQWRRERDERRNRLTTEYQMGVFVGELIAIKYLLNLNIDMLGGGKSVKVSDAERAEYELLEKEWASTKEGSPEHKTAWERMRTMQIELTRKYLPETIDCHFPLMRIPNMDEFKRGVGDAIWDCDYSNYDCRPENIEVVDDTELYSTTIRLKLSITPLL